MYEKLQALLRRVGERSGSFSILIDRREFDEIVTQVTGLIERCAAAEIRRDTLDGLTIERDQLSRRLDVYKKATEVAEGQNQRLRKVNADLREENNRLRPEVEASRGQGEKRTGAHVAVTVPRGVNEVRIKFDS
jgi:hypothetical protein